MGDAEQKPREKPVVIATGPIILKERFDKIFVRRSKKEVIFFTRARFMEELLDVYEEYEASKIIKIL